MYSAQTLMNRCNGSLYHAHAHLRYNRATCVLLPAAAVTGPCPCAQVLPLCGSLGIDSTDAGKSIPDTHADTGVTGNSVAATLFPKEIMSL